MGVKAAFIFRIVFAFGANYLFGIAWIKIWWCAIWVIHNLIQDFFGKNKVRSPQMKSTETVFLSGVYKALIADLAISFDNVIGEE